MKTTSLYRELYTIILEQYYEKGIEIYFRNESYENAWCLDTTA